MVSSIPLNLESLVLTSENRSGQVLQLLLGLWNSCPQTLPLGTLVLSGHKRKKHEPHGRPQMHPVVNSLNFRSSLSCIHPGFDVL